MEKKYSAMSVVGTTLAPARINYLGEILKKGLGQRVPKGKNTKLWVTTLVLIWKIHPSELHVSTLKNFNLMRLETI